MVSLTPPTRRTRTEPARNNHGGSSSFPSGRCLERIFFLLLGLALGWMMAILTRYQEPTTLPQHLATEPVRCPDPISCDPCPKLPACPEPPACLEPPACPDPPPCNEPKVDQKVAVLPPETSVEARELSGNAEGEKTNADRRPADLYGGLCNATVIGEKQPWNQHKKVISFSVFGPALDTRTRKKTGNTTGDLLPWVKEGIRIQSVTAKQFYPDWVIRYYAVNLSPETEQVIVNTYDNVELVRCDPQATSQRMMILRFLVIDDPTVMVGIIRDIDSRFTLRELMAVNEWLASPEHLFHSMRDHGLHMAPVMGCCFGMRRGLFEKYNTNMTFLAKEAFTTYPNPDREKIPGGYGEDQNLMEDLWGRFIRDETMDHDMKRARCERFEAKTCRDFPVGPRDKKQYYFVGAPFKEKEKYTPNVTGHHCALNCTMY